MFYDELKGKALDAYNTMNDTLIQKAEKSLGLSFGAGELVLRSLLPTDIGLTTTQDWSFAITGTSAYSNMVNTPIADTVFIGINGLSLAPTTTVAASSLDVFPFSGLRLSRGNKVARVWNLQGLHGQGNNADPTKTYFTDEPVTVDQNISLQIELYNLVASSTEVIALLGSVCEPAGRTIAGGL